MNRMAIYEQLEGDEGVKYVVYEDTVGCKTFGVGHRVLETDPEYEWEIDTPVSKDRVLACFNADLNKAIEECQDLYGTAWDGFPGVVQEVLVNMIFNLGKSGLRGFKKMNAALLKGDWAAAADEGTESQWFRQVKKRAERLMGRLRGVRGS